MTRPVQRSGSAMKGLERIVVGGARTCPDRKGNTMSDSTIKPEDVRRSRVRAAMFVAILSAIAVAASLHLAGHESGFALVTTSSHMTWGGGGFTVAIAALALPFAALAATRGEGDERVGD